MVQSTKRGQWNTMLLFLTIVLGASVRFAPAAISGFPINDGGMFYVMVRDLQVNHYYLPFYTTYNDLNIPFVYPPLPLYMAGLVSEFFSVPLIEIFRWLPALITTVSLFAFYLLALSVLDSRSQATLATAAFALVPRSISWFIMGGGLTRAFGQLFLLLTLYSIYNLFTKNSRKYLVCSILAGSAVVLSHPESALHAVACCILFWLFLARSKTGGVNALLVAVGILLVISPVLIILVSRHGLAPFQSAFQTGGHSRYFWPTIATFVTFIFAEERFITWVTVLGLLGGLASLVKRQYLLPIWLAIPFFVEPRSAPAISVFPLAMLAAVGLSEIVFPAVISLQHKVSGQPLALEGVHDWADLAPRSGFVRLALGFFILSAFYGIFYFDIMTLARLSLAQSDRDAMAWVAENTPVRSRFVILTGKGGDSLFSDAVQEWFPALTSRRSLSTLQGNEWLLGSEFMQRMKDLGDLQECMNDDVICIEKWSKEHNLPYGYVYVQKLVSPAGYLLAKPGILPRTLLSSLRDADDYILVYENDAVALFAYRASSRYKTQGSRCEISASFSRGNCYPDALR